MAIRKNISEGTDRGIHPLPGPETGVLSAGMPVCKKRHLTVKTCILLAFIMILMAGFGAVADAATTFTVTACTDCHTYPPTESATRDTPTGAVVGSHAKHNDESIACTTCHVDTTSGETDLAHRDGNIDLNNPLHSGSGAYSKGSSFAQANDLDGSGLGTCSNIYCHSNIQTVNGTAAADTYGTPSWGGSSLACDTCHGQDPDETDGMPASGSHNLHAGSQIGELNYACTVCHNNGGSGNANHANDTLNMDIDNTYGASATHPVVAGMEVVAASTVTVPVLRHGVLICQISSPVQNVMVSRLPHRAFLRKPRKHRAAWALIPMVIQQQRMPR
jgi:predicted CxxxxCH...CXXCH cytochrome family protein